MTYFQTHKSFRPATVASLFYPRDAKKLKENIQHMLDEATRIEDEGSSKNEADELHLKALIVPHAGYAYSGETASLAYHLLHKKRNAFRKITLLGPAHRVWLKGIALPSHDAFETPLGQIPLAKNLIKKILPLPDVEIRDDAHKEEHCLEVQLPFLQVILEDFEILPLLVGKISPKNFSEFLEILLDDPQNLLLLSTDLSHFLSYSEAQAMDEKTAQAIESLETEKILPEHACGVHPLQGLLHHARIQKWKVQRLRLCNSGDTAGSKDRVVGYGAWVLNKS